LAKLGRLAAPGRERSRRAAWWDPWLVALIILGAVINGLLALTLWRQFDTFPELIGLHFNAYGEVDLIGGKNEIFKLPIIGAIIWGANAALGLVAAPRDRVLARLILGVAVLVQVIFAVAAWRMLR
jgi:hypothetical protein